jgi:hypothetical protein
MSVARIKIAAALISSLFAFAATGAIDAANASQAPVKLIQSFDLGWEVNKLDQSDVCVVSTNECQQAKASAQPGGFWFPGGVAGTSEGNFYVGDPANDRVQEFTGSGKFVLMFGDEVNETMDGTPGATEEQKDVCTEQEIEIKGVKCKQGVPDTSGGALYKPSELAVEAGTGDVYALEEQLNRVVKYTGTGSFLWTVGSEVNETMDNTPGATVAQKNLCTAESKDVCKGGTSVPVSSTEAGAFGFGHGGNDRLAAAAGLLYVGDNGDRVQKFSPTGEYEGEIPSPFGVPAPSDFESAAASVVATNAGTVYVAYREDATIRSFDGKGSEAGSFTIQPRTAESPVRIKGLALDPAGRLAVLVREAVGGGSNVNQFGLLYEPLEGRVITGFTAPGEGNGLQQVISLGFNGNGELYAAIDGAQEVHAYRPVPVGEMISGSSSCKPGAEAGSDATFTCELNGSVNPYNVSATEAWFEWGPSCAFGASTPRQAFAAVEEPLALSRPVAGLRPNQAFCYRLVGIDENVQLPEQLTGAEASGRTPSVAPRTLGEPHTSFVSASSGVLYGQVNPENAPTRYYYELAKQEPAGGSALEGCPLGQKGACPGVLVSGAGESEVYGATPAILEASGLQPATTYSYRLTASNEAGFAAGKAEGAFTTAALAPPEEVVMPPPPAEPPPFIAAPVTPALLSVPPVAFPKAAAPPASTSCKRGYTRNRRGVCIKSKHKVRKGHKTARRTRHHH